MIRTRHILLLAAILIGAIAEAFAQVPEDSELYRTIAGLDREYFQAYNTCDLDTQAALLDDARLPGAASIWLGLPRTARRE